MAAGVLDELLIGLGFEFDEKQAKTFRKSVDDVSASVSRFTKMALAAAAAFGFYAKSSNDAAFALERNATILNTTVEALDSLHGAAEIAMGSSDGLSNSLMSLQAAASQVARGEGPITAFGRIGLQVLDVNGNIKDTVTLFAEAADAIKALPQGQQLDYARQIGLGEQFLLLQEGSAGIRELMADTEALGVTTTEVGKNARDFNVSIQRLTRSARVLGHAIFKDVMPWLTEWFDKTTTFVATLRDRVNPEMERLVEAFGSWGRVMQAAGLIFASLFGGKLVKSIFALLTATTGLKTVFKALGAILFPFLGFWGALAIAIGLAAEDLYQFATGGESAIGSLAEKFPALGTVIKGLGPVFKALGTIASKAFGGVKDLFSSAADAATHLFGDSIDRAKAKVKDFWNTVVTAMSDDSWEDNVAEWGEAVGDAIADAIRNLPNLLSDALGGVADFLFGEVNLETGKREGNMFSRAYQKTQEWGAKHREPLGKATETVYNSPLLAASNDDPTLSAPTGELDLVKTPQGLIDALDAMAGPLTTVGSVGDGSGVPVSNNTTNNNSEAATTNTYNNTYNIDGLNMSKEEWDAWQLEHQAEQNQQADTKLRNSIGI